MIHNVLQNLGERFSLNRKTIVFIITIDTKYQILYDCAEEKEARKEERRERAYYCKKRAASASFGQFSSRSQTTSFDVSSRNCVLAMVFSYSFDSAIRLTLDEAQGKAQEYVLFVSTIASLLEHCASTPFRRFVANTLPPTPGPFTNTRAPACFTRTRSPFLRFLRRRLLLPPFPPPLSSPHFPHLLLSLSLSLSLVLS